MERLTLRNVEQRVENLNRRMEAADSSNRFQIQARNVYIGLDCWTRDPAATISLPNSVPGRGYGWICQSTVMCGTKREVAEFLHAMMVGIDMARLNDRA